MRQGDNILGEMHGLRDRYGVTAFRVDDLEYIDRRIHSDMIRAVVRRLTAHGINVKGYFMLGFPGETAVELFLNSRHRRRRRAIRPGA